MCSLKTPLPLTVVIVWMGFWYPFSLQMMADIICKVHVFVHCSIADYLDCFLFSVCKPKGKNNYKKNWLDKNNKYKNELVGGITIVVHGNLLKLHNLLVRQCQTRRFSPCPNSELAFYDCVAWSTQKLLLFCVDWKHYIDIYQSSEV